MDLSGKTFVVMVASSPGGGTDTTARLVARYWSKYLPGKPEVVVRNRPLQTAAANYFQRKARPDGLTTAVFAGGGSLSPVARKASSVRYDPLSWEYIGSIERGPSVQFVRKSALERLKDPGAKPVAVGSSGPGYRPSDAMAVYGAEYGGWNIKIVHGYPSSRDVYLAYERGEVDMFGSGTSRIIRRFLKGDAVALAVHEKRADFPEVPTLEELLGDKLPKGDGAEGVPDLVGSQLRGQVLRAAGQDPGRGGDGAQGFLRQGAGRSRLPEGRQEDPRQGVPAVDRSRDQAVGQGLAGHSRRGGELQRQASHEARAADPEITAAILEGHCPRALIPRARRHDPVPDLFRFVPRTRAHRNHA